MIVITDWDPSRQRIWADISDNGYVVYGEGVSLWSHHIPTVGSIYQPGETATIIDPGNIARDFSFDSGIF